MRRKPEKATTTHPAVARAVAELVKEAGGRPLIGDSPGGYHFYTRRRLESVYETCGMTRSGPGERGRAQLRTPRRSTSPIPKAG